MLTANGGNPSGPVRIDIVPDGALTWIIGPDQEKDFASLSGLTFWPS